MSETVVERERRLLTAAQLYLHGNISYDDLTAIRRQAAPPPAQGGEARLTGEEGE